MSAPNEKPKRELDKLGSGETIDHSKLHEEMEDDRLDRVTHPANDELLDSPEAREEYKRITGREP